MLIYCRAFYVLIVYLLLTMLGGCMPHVDPAGPPIIAAKILPKRFLTADGTLLPLQQWLPSSNPPKAILIAVHGFNDYSHFFQQPAEYFSQHGIACYAYDQRGFGGSPRRGLWSGTATYSQDLATFIRLVQRQNPRVPIYLLGESMGAAVVIATMSQMISPPIAGMILSAPAVWARDTMPWYQQTLLWTLAHSAPSLTLTGRGLKILASDNIPMLQALGRDQQVIKATRVDALYGLADLMDTAQQQAGQIQQTSLLLYGDHDQLIPKTPTYQFIGQFLQNHIQHKTVAFYKDGYHMLLRDLNAPIVWQDILTWINSPGTPLPSGGDRYAKLQLTDLASGNVE
jgi:alpha-beta hydrolase superfamily lysophospholipase